MICMRFESSTFLTQLPQRENPLVIYHLVFTHPTELSICYIVWIHKEIVSKADVYEVKLWKRKTGYNVIKHLIIVDVLQREIISFFCTLFFNDDEYIT